MSIVQQIVEILLQESGLHALFYELASADDMHELRTTEVNYAGQPAICVSGLTGANPGAGRLMEMTFRGIVEEFGLADQLLGIEVRQTDRAGKYGIRRPLHSIKIYLHPSAEPQRLEPPEEPQHPQGPRY